MTASWSSGYATDVAYTVGFYRELAPTLLDYACTLGGVAGIEWRPGLRYCELGCGRGFGTALLAAANPDMQFVGIDFNPSHVAEARAFAARAELPNVTFREMSFAEAARSAEPELAEFNVVALHGVYSWVMPQVRGELHDFLRTKLVAGGIAYVSYNTMPGWAVLAPVQRLLYEVAERAAGDSLAQIGKGMEVLKTLIEQPSALSTQNPALKARFARMEKQDRHYLAHEFLNAGWSALYVTDAMKALSEAKMVYVGSANMAENRIELCVPAELRDLVRAAPDAAMRELYKDFAINKQFRRDVYVKGPLPLNARAQQQRWERTAFALTRTAKGRPGKIRVPIGELAPPADAIEAILDRLASGPAAGAELVAAAAKAGKKAEAPALVELLVHEGSAHPCRPDHARVDPAAVRRLNKVVMDSVAAGDVYRYLASPVLGSALPVSFVDRVLALLDRQHAGADETRLAGLLFDRLSAVGQLREKDGSPARKNDENIRAVAEGVKEFRALRLPRWRALGMVG